MALHRTKLYTILVITCLAGYIWLYYGMTTIQNGSNSFEVCLFKHATTLPCPSCGATRSVISLLQGNPLKSIYINPLGLFIATIMAIIPIWVLTDLLTKKSSLFNFYGKTEAFLKKPRIAIPLILLVILNWIWNITKGL